jgi:hypothetical protein
MSIYETACKNAQNYHTNFNIKESIDSEIIDRSNKGYTSFKIYNWKPNIDQVESLDEILNSYREQGFEVECMDLIGTACMNLDISWK